jgi:hypothetical protein
MPGVSGNGLGLLVVLIAFFVITAITLTTIGSTANAMPSFSDALSQAANNLWIISTILIAILVIIVVIQARGSARFDW